VGALTAAPGRDELPTADARRCARMRADGRTWVVPGATLLLVCDVEELRPVTERCASIAVDGMTGSASIRISAVAIAVAVAVAVAERGGPETPVGRGSESRAPLNDGRTKNYYGRFVALSRAMLSRMTLSRIRLSRIMVLSIAIGAGAGAGAIAAPVLSFVAVS
jgi:hypothetical protein